MSTESNISLRISFKELACSYKCIDEDSLSGDWSSQSYPLLHYVEHEIVFATTKSTAPTNLRSMSQSIIQAEPSSRSEQSSVDHSITVKIPFLVLNIESMALKVFAAIEQAVDTISQNAYAEGDYNLIDTVRMILAKEINAAFAKVIWNTSVPIVHSGVTESFWYQGQLLADFRVPIMAIWRHNPLQSSLITDVSYLVA
ncbi:hypothetical protein [Paenibacillus sp. FSL R7-0333]|uniref:hypothetical protein n=1 Tax=Paenibacillus sp. FSL R7-0333 TaxID=1926587 RepID=UPI00096F4E01|nr:hypothetical protein BK146_28390 [Paenibacillus sp. FSL R7-0333]